MKFAWIRYVSLFLVLCFCLCLMSSFVFGAEEELSPFYFSGSLEPMSLDGLSLYAFTQKLSESDLVLLQSFLGGSVYISIPAFGVSSFFIGQPSPDGVSFLLDESTSLVLGFMIDSGDYYLVLSSPSVSGPFSGYIFNEIVPDTSSDLLSDVRLTGTSFLETVQGIVLTIIKNPLLLLTVGIFFVGGCIALFSRLFSKN